MHRVLTDTGIAAAATANIASTGVAAAAAPRAIVTGIKAGTALTKAMPSAGKLALHAGKKAFTRAATQAGSKLGRISAPFKAVGKGVGTATQHLARSVKPILKNPIPKGAYNTPVDLSPVLSKFPGGNAALSAGRGLSGALNTAGKSVSKVPVLGGVMRLGGRVATGTGKTLMHSFDNPVNTALTLSGFNPITAMTPQALDIINRANTDSLAYLNND